MKRVRTLHYYYIGTVSFHSMLKDRLAKESIKLLNMKQSKHIDLDKKYSFPINLSTVRHQGKILVISVETACWLLFENEEQFKFFEFLKENTIREAMDLFAGSHADVIHVITEIEAKHFEDRNVLKQPKGNLHLYLTNNCNMHCPHCYMFAGEKLKNEITTEEVKSFLQSYSEHGKTEMTISGGEATTRKDLLKIVEFAHAKGLKVRLLTNGYLLSDNFIDSISPLLYQIQISVDGYSEEENAKVRNKGSFTNVLHSVDRFVRNGVPTEIAITPYCDDSLGEKVHEYANFGKTLKEKYAAYNFKVKFTTGILDGRETNFNNALREQYRKTMMEVTNLYFGKDVSEDSFIGSIKRKRIYDNCSYGGLTVSANGYVYACSRILGIKPYANIRTHSFEYIWEVAKKAEALSNISNLEPCNKCNLMYICGGNCRIKYFPFFKNCSGYDNVNGKIKRDCNQSIKNSFYDLMIKTNKRIYQ